MSSAESYDGIKRPRGDLWTEAGGRRDSHTRQKTEDEDILLTRSSHAQSIFELLRVLCSLTVRGLVWDKAEQFR